MNRQIPPEIQAKLFLVFSCVLIGLTMFFSYRLGLTDASTYSQYAEQQRTAIRLAGIFSDPAHPTVICDNRGTILDWNIGMSLLTGCTKQAAEGKNIAEFIPKNMRAGHNSCAHDKSGLIKLAAGETVEIANAELEDSLSRKVPVHVRVAATTISGKQLFVVSITQAAKLKLIDARATIPESPINVDTNNYN